jgi:hypothetical protein
MPATHKTPSLEEWLNLLLKKSAQGHAQQLEAKIHGLCVIALYL